MQGYITVGVDSLLTVKEAAVRLKTSTPTVHALCASGRLAHLRISRHAIRIAGGDLGRFVRLTTRDSRTRAWLARAELDLRAADLELGTPEAGLWGDEGAPDCSVERAGVSLGRIACRAVGRMLVEYRG
jgi:excisionase family DNA binding protein